MQYIKKPKKLHHIDNQSHLSQQTLQMNLQKTEMRLQQLGQPEVVAAEAVEIRDAEIAAAEVEVVEVVLEDGEEELFPC